MQRRVWRYIHIDLRVHIFSNVHRYNYTNIQTHIFTFKILALALLAYWYAYMFLCSQTYMVLIVYIYRHTLVDQGSCGAFFEPIFLDNLRRLVDSPMGVFGDGTKSVQHSWTPTKWRVRFHLAQGINLMIWKHRFLQVYSIMLNDAPADLAAMEGSRYVKGLDVTMP